MKYLSIALVVLIAAAVVAAGCLKKPEKAETTVAKIDTTPSQVVTLDVEGMTCTGCEATIKTAVKKVQGVKQVEADYESGTATVTINPEKADIDKVIAAIDAAGYKAKKKKDS